MEKPCAKSILVGEHERSFRSSRTAPLYNIQDYLPPTGLLSRTIITQPRPHKIYTQPNQHISQLPRNDHQAEELSKRIEALSYQKQQAQHKAARCQRRVQELQNEEKKMQQRIRDLTQKLDSLQRNNDELHKVLNMKPSLQLQRNCTHFILYPKHQQRYQVSIQTDAIETTPLQSSPFIAQSKHSDRQMLQIQDKLSRLTLAKAPKKQTRSSNSFKPRFTGARQDKQNNMKQNNMRSSNTFDRMGTITDEKIREEHMEVLPIDNEKLERLIQLYMD